MTDKPVGLLATPAGYAEWLAEYALRNLNKPLGISEYELVESLPENLQSSLPSIEQIESELGDGRHHE
ncbi:hypothetical protein [Nitrosomonas sp.]|uniref:hypothetical protein n=1 Tax=Nitrosomonas sp. TaxID=42353 RepID=UPI0026133DCD|nr:hypothetical protein [Nitrosomonas sp.]